jgi:hypothetical protein
MLTADPGDRVSVDEHGGGEGVGWAVDGAVAVQNGALGIHGVVTGLSVGGEIAGKERAIR